MRIGHINASDDQLWRWFPVPGTNARLEIKLITTVESNAFKNPKNDPAAYRLHVAKNWFRGFENILDANGAPIENTEANRAAILIDMDLWVWLQSKLGRSQEWWDEGKGDSGSAS